MATRTCASGDRIFEITLARTPVRNDSWTVEHVFDRSLNQEVSVPGMESIVGRWVCTHLRPYRQVVAAQDLTTALAIVRHHRPLSIELDEAFPRPTREGRNQKPELVLPAAFATWRRH